MYIFVVFCLHVTKSKQIPKIIVARRSQGLYGVIEDADSEYDTKKNVICINLLNFYYMLLKVNKFRNMIINTNFKHF